MSYDNESRVLFRLSPCQPLRAFFSEFINSCFRSLPCGCFLVVQLARLRVQAATLAAENDELRTAVGTLNARLATAQASAELEGHDSELERREVVGEAAARVAELEERSNRQQRVLQVYTRYTTGERHIYSPPYGI